MLPTIEAYQVHHRPIVKADADQMGFVEVITQVVPPEMALDPGTMVLGMLLETLSGRSPLSRLAEFFAHQATDRLLGKPIPPGALDEDPVGRGFDRRSDAGTMQVFTACAVRAEQVLRCAKRSVHFDTTSRTVYGDAVLPEAQEGPLTLPQGESKAKRPDLKPCVCATLCVDRAVPLGGQPAEGQAAENTVQNPLLSTIATCLAQPGVAPGASLSVADAALVTEDHLGALGATLCITRFPAPANACGRSIAEAVADHPWDARGTLAHTPPTTHRPGTA